MADAASHATKPQTLPPPQIHANPTKFFLYKAALVTLFLVLLPLFPSLAPEFINQTLHARSWEFLQLIFVGIAVSYGLFSKKNDETEKDHNISKPDNAQSYVSKLLQVSSVFEDESENQALIDENKVQTWTSQYYREEPPVVAVAKERETTTPVVKEDHFVAAKPLLLPVRSLKHRLPEEISQKPDLIIDDKIGRSNSKRFSVDSRRPKVGEFGGVNSEKENVVLRSPIPWRSRSGRIEFNENGDGNKDNSSIDDRAELNRSSKPNLSPTTSFSSESQAKSSENVVRRKNLSSTPAPPPPPPPPPPPLPFLRKSNSSVAKSSNGASSDKPLRRSFRSVPAEELSESEIEEPPRTRMNLQNNKWSQARKSVGTFKSTDNYETNVVDKKAVIESSDDESEEEEEEDDYFEDIISSDINGKSDVTIDNTNDNNNNGEVVGGGPDVDKKADEFIAKFREQIRLQRIESIRRSTAQRAGKTTLR
ncbi:hypothetical protein BUALT_Bualt10G0021500 [Buddleja alternifolia]|uniref:Hydroxyproline-rich glycoprotein family protein n=1 Tax=Buddleja alternifolia TaxID=168488 RepID=A0AAV6WVG1_9LAMI|nr:hypothetical protein BUALT_Bualt10G0021500 [Buddleja alternifolia]